MRKLLTGFAAASALALLATAAQAECFQGHVTAKAPSEEKVAMNTTVVTPATTVEVEKAAAEAVAAPACPEGAADCPPANNE